MKKLFALSLAALAIGAGSTALEARVAPSQQGPWGYTFGACGCGCNQGCGCGCNRGCCGNGGYNGGYSGSYGSYGYQGNYWY